MKSVFNCNHVGISLEVGSRGPSLQLALARSVLLAEKKEAEQMGSLRLRHFDNLKFAK